MAALCYSIPACSPPRVKSKSSRSAIPRITWRIIARLVSLTPPDIRKPSRDDLWELLKLGRKVRGLGKKEMMRLLRWGPMAVADFAAEFFETDLLRGIVAAQIGRASCR